MSGRDRLQNNPALYRAELSAGIAKRAAEGVDTPPSGISAERWAIYMLACAIEDMAKGLNR